MKLILYLATAISAMGIIETSAQSVIFVSPEGDDNNSGTLEYPFKSISKAQYKARELDGDICIYLREGEYRIDNPIVFTPDDGNDSKSLTLSSYNNEHVSINGSDPVVIGKWEPYKDNILKTTVKLDFPVDMLIVNGKIRHMARFPNYDPDGVRFNGTSSSATAPERVKSWKNPEGGFLHVMHAHDWGDFHYRITGKDNTGNLLLEGGHQNNRKSGLHPDNRMVENIFEELDCPEEWYYNASESSLFYYPASQEDVTMSYFEVPRLKHLVEFRGSMTEPVKNITIRGIEFCNTARTFMEKYEPLLRSDWTIYRGGAIILEGTENCHLENLHFHNLGGNAVFFSYYNRQSGVTKSHFNNIGASAVCFVGDPEAVRSPAFEYNEYVSLEDMDTMIGSKSDNYPEDCEVHDNLITKIGLFEKQVTGIELSMCRSIKVSHNSIYDVPRSGINVSEGTWGGHIIEYNDIFDTVKETGDHGSFNSWGRDRFWHPDYSQMAEIVKENPSLILADASSTVIIRNNRFRCDRGWDIDLDDGSSNYHIYNNLCLNGGIKLREGFYRIVENNILVNNTFHPHVWFDDSGDVFTRNIVMTPYRPINVNKWGSHVDYNIFAGKSILDNVMKNGTDSNSIYCSLDFVNPAEGDYTLKHSCHDVFRIGFQNFDMDNFGVKSPHLRKIAGKPVMPLPIINDGTDKSEFKSWHGWNIKNLETLGERSATGMDSERGVYVISLSVFNNPLRDYIKANDVILEFAGKPVNTMDDLFEAERHIDRDSDIRITIFRNQKENVINISSEIFK